MRTFAYMRPQMDATIAYDGHEKMNATGINNSVFVLPPIIIVDVLLIGLTTYKIELLFFT